MDTRENEIINELKNIEYVDLDDMVHWMELIYDEILDTSDVKNTAAYTLGYTIPPGI